MAGIDRTASSVWTGDIKDGVGTINASSDVLTDTKFGFATRFGNAPGTNPEELIAAAHAACYSMALANYLGEQGHVPESVTVTATLTLDTDEKALTKMHLVANGVVPGIDAEQFAKFAAEAEKNCPVSNVLRNGLTITLDAKMG